MQGSGLFLLVMGAVNLVNLLLIRASSHMKDMAIRRSMGASRRHVVSHVMVETLLLTLLGGLLGLVVGASGIRLLEVLGADHLPLGARIASMAGWRRLALLARLFWESSSGRRSHGSTCATISRMRSDQDPARARSAALLSAFAKH